MKRTAILAILLLIPACGGGGGGGSPPAPPVPDTFDPDNMVVFPASGTDDSATAVAIQADGNLVVVGSAMFATQDVIVMRRLPDGTPDVTFGGAGLVVTDVSGAADRSHDVVLQAADGRIVVAANGSVLRYNTDGTLDTAFSADGISTMPFSGIQTSLAIQGDGKIIYAGELFSGINFDWAVARLNTDGSLDTSFSTDGYATLDIGGFHDRSRDVAIQSDGKIVVTGLAVGLSDFCAARFNTDGSVDTGFDTDGIVITDFGATTDDSMTVAIAAGDKILIAGRTTDAFGIIQYNTNGSLDTAFDGDGMAIVTPGPGANSPYSILVQPDTRLVLVGQTNGGLAGDVAVARLLSDGSPDTSFDTDGFATIAPGANQDYASDVARQSDGKLIIVGLTTGAAGTDVLLIRIP